MRKTLFRKSRFVLFCIRFHKSGFSFASLLIKRVIKDIFSTLMYVCVKRNVCLNLWLANMLYFVFIDVVITLFFWFTMHCNFHWGGVIWKCWCMSMYWSMLSSTALVCIVDLISFVDLVCVRWNVTYAEDCRSVVSLQEPLRHSLWSFWTCMAS